MKRITTKRHNDGGFQTLEYLIDGLPINIKVQYRDNPKKVWLRIDHIQITMPNVILAERIARAIVTKISQGK